MFKGFQRRQIVLGDSNLNVLIGGNGVKHCWLDRSITDPKLNKTLC
jgi:hypothetical protein